VEIIVVYPTGVVVDVRCTDGSADQVLTKALHPFPPLLTPENAAVLEAEKAFLDSIAPENRPMTAAERNACNLLVAEQPGYLSVRLDLARHMLIKERTPAATGDPVAESAGVAHAPWERTELRDWCIVGMNHYHVAKRRHLFVSMARNGYCITAEGAEEARVWDSLVTQATERAAVEAARSTPKVAG
jgi:hypothetical protein